MIYRMPNLDTLIELHNDYRKEKSWWYSIEPLEKDSVLMEYAHKWALHMSSVDKMSHSDIKYLSSIGYGRVGENVAFGQKDEISVMKSWIKSSGHRRNILNKHFTNIGCGFSYSDTDRIYWCVCFGKSKNK